MATAASSLRSAKSSAGNARFNAEAAAWDTNPFVHTASRHALDAILSRFPALEKSNPTLDVLEIGCGTGLLSLMLAPYAGNVVAVDAAQGMVKVLESKLGKDGGVGKNVTPVCVLLEDPEDPSLPGASEDGGSSGARMKFDLIISHLVLHHIPSLGPVLKTMLNCLKPGGSVALTDFEHTGPEARAFHPLAKMEGVERDGIEPREMEALMREVGFEGDSVKVERAWGMEKRVERFPGEFGKKRPVEGDGSEAVEIRVFPFVVCLGQRKSHDERY
jgi:SAM-dependent methyltransferase